MLFVAKILIVLPMPSAFRLERRSEPWELGWQTIEVPTGERNDGNGSFGRRILKEFQNNSCDRRERMFPVLSGRAWEVGWTGGGDVGAVVGVRFTIEAAAQAGFQGLGGLGWSWKSRGWSGYKAELGGL